MCYLDQMLSHALLTEYHPVFCDQLTRRTKLQTCASGVENLVATSLGPFTCFLFAHTHRQIKTLR